jgi:hypothetical protein
VLGAAATGTQSETVPREHGAMGNVGSTFWSGSVDAGDATGGRATVSVRKYVEKEGK